MVERGYKLLFVESICNDDTIIESNIKEVKTASPDYSNFSEDRVLDDFKKRIGHYQEKYQSLDESFESDFSFMKIYEFGTKVIVHKQEGHIQSRSDLIKIKLIKSKKTRNIFRIICFLLSHYTSFQKLGGKSELRECSEDYSRSVDVPIR